MLDLSDAVLYATTPDILVRFVHYEQSIAAPLRYNPYTLEHLAVNEGLGLCRLPIC